jgi:hypothetical protein
MSDEREQQGATTPGKGGFGAFAQKYRDRWAANHPNPETTQTEGTSMSISASDTPAADAGLPGSGTES